MKKFEIVGRKYIHFFKNGNAVVKVDSTENEYKQLALKEAKQPTKKNHTWWYSIENYLYDSNDGDLPINGYAINEQGFVYSNRNGRVSEDSLEEITKDEVIK